MANRQRARQERDAWLFCPSPIAVEKQRERDWQTNMEESIKFEENVPLNQIYYGAMSNSGSAIAGAQKRTTGTKRETRMSKLMPIEELKRLFYVRKAKIRSLASASSSSNLLPNDRNDAKLQLPNLDSPTVSKILLRRTESMKYIQQDLFAKEESSRLDTVSMEAIESVLGLNSSQIAELENSLSLPGTISETKRFEDMLPSPQRMRKPSSGQQYSPVEKLPYTSGPLLLPPLPHGHPKPKKRARHANVLDIRTSPYVCDSSPAKQQEDVSAVKHRSLFIKQKLLPAHKHHVVPYFSLLTLRREQNRCQKKLSTLSSTLSADLAWVRQHCRQDVTAYQGGQFCKRWGGNALQQTLIKISNRQAQECFMKWKTAVLLMKKKELASKYLQLKGSRKVLLLLSSTEMRRLRVAFHKWSFYLGQLQLEELIRYTIRIQCKFRSLLARRKVEREKNLRLITFIQARVRVFLKKLEMRRCVVASQIALRRRSAVVIQQHWRFKLRLKKHESSIKRLSDCEKIQKVYRGHMARRVYRLRCLLFVFSESALMIAATFRGYRCRKSLRQELQSRKLQVAKEEAALQIQTRYRQHLANKCLQTLQKALRTQVQVEKAALIQRWYRLQSVRLSTRRRGRVHRWILKRMRRFRNSIKSKKERLEREHLAVLCLQKFWRRRAAWNLLCVLRRRERCQRKIVHIMIVNRFVKAMKCAHEERRRQNEVSSQLSRLVCSLSLVEWVSSSLYPVVLGIGLQTAVEETVQSRAMTKKKHSMALRCFEESSSHRRDVPCDEELSQNLANSFHPAAHSDKEAQLLRQMLQTEYVHVMVSSALTAASCLQALAGRCAVQELALQISSISHEISSSIVLRQLPKAIGLAVKRSEVVLHEMAEKVAIAMTQKAVQAALQSAASNTVRKVVYEQNAAITVQCFIRTILAKQFFSFSKSVKKNKEKELRINTAIVIQCWVRGRFATKERNLLLTVQQQNRTASTKIQSTVRQLLAHIEVKRLKKIAADKKARESVTVVSLQCFVRSVHAMHLLKKLRHEKAELKKAMETAATHLQRIFRGKRVREDVSRKERIRLGRRNLLVSLSEKQLLNLKAAKIQTFYQTKKSAILTRQRIKQQQRELKLKMIELRKLEEFHASRIQKIYRGRKTRLEQHKLQQLVKEELDSKDTSLKQVESEHLATSSLLRSGMGERDDSRNEGQAPAVNPNKLMTSTAGKAPIAEQSSSAQGGMKQAASVEDEKRTKQAVPSSALQASLPTSTNQLTSPSVVQDSVPPLTNEIMSSQLAQDGYRRRNAWVASWDAYSMRPYYINQATQETRWDPPQTDGVALGSMAPQFPPGMMPGSAPMNPTGSPNAMSSYPSYHPGLMQFHQMQPYFMQQPYFYQPSGNPQLYREDVSAEQSVKAGPMAAGMSQHLEREEGTGIDQTTQWEEYYDDTYSLSYYYNVVTEETTWEAPAGFQSKYRDPSKEAPRYY